MGVLKYQNTLQCIWRTQGAWRYLEARQWFNTTSVLCCTVSPSGMVLRGFIAAIENTHMHSIEQVFHRQRECEGQQSLPGVPERV